MHIKTMYDLVNNRLTMNSTLRTQVHAMCVEAARQNSETIEVSVQHYTCLGAELGSNSKLIRKLRNEIEDMRERLAQLEDE